MREETLKGRVYAEFQSLESGRLDKVLQSFLQSRGEKFSRSHVQDLIFGREPMDALVNGHKGKPSTQVRLGDQIVLKWNGIRSQETERSPTTSGRKNRALYTATLQILFEDDALIVVSKPAGMTVHPGAGTKGQWTLIEAVLQHAGPEMAQQFLNESDPAAGGFTFRPGMVHRLDKDTTGVLVIAKNRRAHEALSIAFRDKKDIKRQYLALMEGVLEKPVERQSWLSRDPLTRIKFRSLDEETSGARWSQSYFEPLAVFGESVTLAKVTLRTGRTHQIRLHAKDLGAAVVGDPLYRSSAPLRSPEVRALLAGVQGTGQFLHAFRLEFVHPINGNTLEFIDKLPQRFHEMIEQLKPFRTR